MDYNVASRALDNVDSCIRQMERVKRAMQKAIAEGDEPQVRVLGLHIHALLCQLHTDLPRYYVDGDYFRSYNDALIRESQVNATRGPGNKVRVVDILSI